MKAILFRNDFKRPSSSVLCKNKGISQLFIFAENAIAVITEFRCKVIWNPGSIHLFVDFGNCKFIKPLHLDGIIDLRRPLRSPTFQREFRDVVFSDHRRNPSVRTCDAYRGSELQSIFHTVPIDVHNIIAIVLTDCSERQKNQIDADSISLFK